MDNVQSLYPIKSCCVSRDYLGCLHFHAILDVLVCSYLLPSFFYVLFADYLHVVLLFVAYGDSTLSRTSVSLFTLSVVR